MAEPDPPEGSAAWGDDQFNSDPRAERQAPDARSTSAMARPWPKISLRRTEAHVDHLMLGK